MNLDKKIKKLGLKPLTDETRYELAIDKSKVHLYERYDYYTTSPKEQRFFYSTDYLLNNSYRQIIKNKRKSELKDLKGTWDRWSFRTEMFIRRLISKFNKWMEG